jgi:6-phosphofructokinase 1
MAPGIAVLTSGGDAPGMNAVVRAIVRAGLARGARVHIIEDGFAGLADRSGGRIIAAGEWRKSGGILHQGGTIIGSVRYPEFKQDEKKRDAIANLTELGIDRLIIIGGDGSLTGAQRLFEAWPRLIDEKMAQSYPGIKIVGLAASIDNDLCSVGLTIGTDTALHRINEAIDAINSTAISHQRTFVLEVMGRDCGYLALMAALGGGADWVLIPERPPDSRADRHWEEQLCSSLQKGQQMGRRATLVIVSEGARNPRGRPITSHYVRQVLEQWLDRDVRVTVLGHVQRGGAPSALDRVMGTLLGQAALDKVLTMATTDKPCIPDLRGSEIFWQPIEKALRRNQKLVKSIAARRYHRAVKLRGETFNRAFSVYYSLSRPAPPSQGAIQRHDQKIAVLHAGTLAPGMNTAVRAAVRLAIARGNRVVGVIKGFQGLMQGNLKGKEPMIKEMDWMSVNRWASMGGANLSTSRTVPLKKRHFDAIANNISAESIRALLIIGGWNGFKTACQLVAKRKSYPAFRIPIVCLPATISNNIPGTELSVGFDTALNSIVEAIDKIKQSAIAVNRCFVVEIAGRYCGALAFMAGLATGAERVYLHEDELNRSNLRTDRDQLAAEFNHGRGLGLLLRNEKAYGKVTTTHLLKLLEPTNSAFELRHTVLGHIQLGGDPSPFDRYLASMLTARAVENLIEQLGKGDKHARMVSWEKGCFTVRNLEDFHRLGDAKYLRPAEQWWLNYRNLLGMLGHLPKY